ncbi:amidohydrolase family protein [Adhaeribacter aquaticus]|uniref:amidohydrolase family protein n=1 Tax=Adhaeribacter aquaticus TaxID=299567 RepID=UPI0004101F78|nr:amidohydrolase family protein [Adhaeribacter aquaticus]
MISKVPDLSSLQEKIKMSATDNINGINRRTFSQKAALGFGATMLSPWPDLFAASGNSPVVDTHIHCFAGPADTRFPYHARATYKPDITATPEFLLKCMQEGGVDYAVIVHPEPYQDDNRYLEHCLDVGKGKLKGTILVFADRIGSMDQLSRLAKRGDVIAVRVHAYLPDRLPPFGKPEMRQLWKLAADNGLAMQLHFEPKYASGFEPYLKEFRQTHVILDHLGRPLQATSPLEYKLIESWANYPNTIIKFSNLSPVQASPDPAIMPYVQQMIKAYGPDRMIWGGGFNHTYTGAKYQQDQAYARSFLTNLSAAEKARIMGGNAARLFKFKV